MWDEDDSALSTLSKRKTTYENSSAFMHSCMKKYGQDRMYWNQPVEEVEYEDGKTDYSKPQLEQMADTLLREYGKRELCRECLVETDNEIEGEETGTIESVPQWRAGEPVLSDNGYQIVLDLPELCCPEGHKWFLGEGKSRGNQGDNPVLFEEHLAQRRRREIYTAEGTPDPSIVSGIYNRIHPQGRKVNTDKQRKMHGASFYR